VTAIPTDRHITYQRQMRRCGKASCHKCREGASHGPYWYAYWRNDEGKLRSGYIGKDRPAHLQTSTRGAEHQLGQQEEEGSHACTEPIPA
jgi:hypothetical protein